MNRIKANANLLLALVAVFFIYGMPAAESADLENSGTPMRKLQRGFLNMALSPWEVAHELSKDKKTDSVVPTWAGGLVRGSVYALGRAVTGAYELVTFPVPLPANYAPVVEPEFEWQHFDSEESAKI